MRLIQTWFSRVPVWLVVAALVAAVGAATFAQPAPKGPAAKKADPADAAKNPGSLATQATEGQQQTEKMSFFELLMKGQWFMLPIGLCSLLGVALIFERLFALRRGKVIPPTFLPGLKSVFRNAETDHEEALHYCRSQASPIARVMAVGIRKMPQGVESVEQGIEDAGANEVGKLRRNLRLMFGVASVAPMLGLLGTVWGMIDAFQTASLEGLGGGGQAAQGLAGGIYAALVTTFAGLCVAIPILVFYYYFQGKIERIVTDLNDVSEDFIEHYLTEATNGGTPAAPAFEAQPPARIAPPNPSRAATPQPAT